MAQRDITVLKDVSLITCVVQRGAADPIINAAREAGAQGATVNYGKGMGIRERLGILGVAVEVEKEVIQILVSSEQVDRVFERMYLAGNWILLEWGSLISLNWIKRPPIFHLKF